MDLPEPPRPDLRPPPRTDLHPPPSPTPQTPQRPPIWKRGWFWIGVFVALAVTGTAIEGGQGEGDSDNPSSAAQPNASVEDLPIFDGQPGGQVVALVNQEGIVSAKVLGEL